MTSTIRVVHVVRSDGFAGVERHVATLASAQKELGHHVAVIGGDVDSMRGALAGKRIPHRRAVTVWDTAREIDRLRHCDVLHVHMTAAEIGAAMAIRSWSVPVVSTRHFAGARGASVAGGLIAPIASNRVAAQIAISRYVAERIEGSSVVVHSGVPSVPTRVPAGERRPAVLLVQRLEPEKKTDVALRAFGRSGLAREGWTLRVAGDGSQRAALGALAGQLGIASAVNFLGRRSDVGALMDSAGMLIAPCPVEGLGLTVLEAMAAGLPVVAAASGGHLETAGSLDGAALFPAGDDAAAADLLASLASDPESRDSYGSGLQGLQRAKFTLEAQAQATDAVYRSVL